MTTEVTIKNSSADRIHRAAIRAAVAELRAAWVDICQHTPSTYTCGDWSRMTDAIDALTALATA